MPRHSKHRRVSHPGKVRLAAFGLSLAAIGTGAAAWAGPARAAEPVVVDSLSLTPSSPDANATVTATAKLHAARSVSVQALTVAVRGADGSNYDFRGAVAGTLGTKQQTFTPEGRTFPAGTYKVFVAYETNNVWHNLNPVKTFTSGPASAATPAPSATPTTAAPTTAAPTPTAAPTTAKPTPTAAPTTAAPTTAAPTPTAAPSTAAPASGTGPVGIPGSWRSVWGDEFNATSVDSSKWTANWLGCATCTTPPVNGAESGAYAPSQATVSGGSLHLTAVNQATTVNGTTYPYRSGMVQSNGKAQFTYGAFEARIYLPPSGSQVANWPAFWTDGQSWPADGEMDIMEGLSGQACYHYHSPSGGPGGCAGGNFSGWHTFGADWEPGSVTYYYDGVKVGQITSGISSSPQYVILNNAVSSGNPTVTPADMQVDYVRVWQH
ncbi:MULTISPECIES: glycoside hydrolase family 16 protein [Kitasatospora]|uniref:Beta-glucanase (GH16 family) n=2 Tax=Kitasatospora TaxID=2063 RepID=A0ABT1IU15_9ACTN|nr:glycoside hydrolase family 16 protein [Kitasatospora paracochleata]MCP2308622.1 beta-glucanase (GH16 family) [Kitasatospora paracochleata]